MTTVASPVQGAALRRLGMLRTDELPMLAAYWLTTFDSPSLRELAGLRGYEGWLIDRLWPATLTDLDVSGQSDEAAWESAIAFQVAALRAGERSATEVMRQVARAYVSTGYPSRPPEAGWLHGLEDELDGDWGRSPQEVLAEVEQIISDWADRT